MREPVKGHVHKREIAKRYDDVLVCVGLAPNKRSELCVLVAEMR